MPRRTTVAAGRRDDLVPAGGHRHAGGERSLPSRLGRETAILMGAALAARILGFAYRILLARTIGAEALGLFQMALPVFLIILTAASLGLPVGLAQLVARSQARDGGSGAVALRASALRLAVVAGGTGGVVLLATAPLLASGLLRDGRTAVPLAVLAWALPVAVVEGVHRGYWQGLRRMWRVGLAQAAENVVRLGALVAWVSLAGRLEAAAGAALAAAGVLLGELAELAVVATGASRSRRAGGGGAARAAVGPLLRLSYPVALTRVANTCGMALEAVLIPLLLIAGGQDRTAAVALFGQLTGMAVPVVMLPTVIMYPLGQVLVPAVSAAAARRDRRALRREVAAAALVSGTVGWGAGAMLWAAARPVAVLLYNAPHLVPLLQACAIIPPGLFAGMAGRSVLNGLGRTGASLASQICGISVRILLILALTARFAPHADGAALAMGLGDAAAAVVAWAAVRRGLMAAAAG